MSHGRPPAAASREGGSAGGRPSGPWRCPRLLVEARRLLDFFLPAACLSCGTRIPMERGEALVCDTCASRLRGPPRPGCPRCDFPLGTARGPGRPCLHCGDWPEALAGARAAVVLEPPASHLVHALKYEGWRELGTFLGARMRPLVDALDPGREALLVPVPTTRKRIRARGYSQAAVLAEALVRAGDRPVVDALARRSGEGTQVSLHPTQRKANVQNAFTVRPEGAARVARRRVVVVDDVLTTGATAGAVAEALAGAGAAEVRLVTFARALPHHRRVSSAF